MIILSEEFQQFVDRAGRVMERALCETVDIYTDYSGIGEEALDEKCHQRISFNRTFFDERYYFYIVLFHFARLAPFFLGSE